MRFAVPRALLLSLACLLPAAASQKQCAGQGTAQPAPKRPPGAQVDQPVEDFMLRELTAGPGVGRDAADDGTVRLSDFRGKKHVVLFFFSEKCGHTKRYAKRIAEFVKRNVGDEVAFLGLRSSADDSPDSIRRFARSLRFEFPVLDDPEGRTARYYRVQVAPTFVLIDREGVMRYFGSFDNDDAHGHGIGASQFFLGDALDAVRSGADVQIKRALPFG